MFGSRRGRPSLIGRAAQTAARTAVIAGTATAVSGKVAARQAAGAPPRRRRTFRVRRRTPGRRRAAGSARRRIARLQKLAELHAAGVLTAEEFAEQKARILA